MDQDKIRIMRDLITFYSVRQEMIKQKQDRTNVNWYINEQEQKIIDLITHKNKEEMNIYKAFINTQLDDRTLLEQLAEEAAEFTQATLKCIRAYKYNNNATPVSALTAGDNFIEEWYDLKLVMAVLGFIEDKEVKNNPKLRRWAERLGYKDE